MAGPKRYDERRLKDGQVIKVIWHDEEHKLTVVKDHTGCCFKVGAETFRSLSAAAKHITNFPVSGPQFWGLVPKTISHRSSRH